MRLDLNCDIGEGFESSDKAVMPWITSANIACGAHAGDLETIRRTIRLASEHGVGIGAHPGYPDPDFFGRRVIPMSEKELQSALTTQILTLKREAELLGCSLRHVKPHGALYHVGCFDPRIAELIAELIAGIDKNLILFGISGSFLQKAASTMGLPFASEFFADRACDENGALVPRTEPGALITDPAVVRDRVIRMIKKSEVVTVSGKVISASAESVCIHGDSPGAEELVRTLSIALKEEDIHLEPVKGRLP